MNRGIITKISVTLIVTVLVVIGVVSIAVSGRSGQLSISDTDGSSQTIADQPVPVVVTQPARRQLSRDLHIPATLRAYEKADLYAKISGYIMQINVDIGSRVRKGDVLLQIAAPEISDELRQCEAILETKLAGVQAKAAAHKLEKITIDRKERLAQEEAISPQELDEARGHLAEAQANVKVAESEVVVAKVNVARIETLLKYTTITAPFDGVITARNFDHGAFVRSGAEGESLPLFTLAMANRIRLVIEIPESDVPLVRVGTKVEIHVKCLEGDVLRTAITRTAVALNPGTRTMRAEADIDNTSGRISPGMYAQVAVKLEEKENALLIPSKAIRVRGRDISVLVSRDSVAISCPVEIGYDDGIWAEIVGGQLKDDDWIITSASSLVAPGAPVKPISQAESHGIVGSIIRLMESGDQDD
ncbi:MAG: efflux RND transporter periplasmic adaptor subunit [Planctomycetes bacterium]|nr:efflux RND transporter periplasmic adaptor subunit [Planctomycetota bacterium]